MAWLGCVQPAAADGLAQPAIFRAVADAHTDASAPKKNFGAKTSLRAISNSSKRAYIRFWPRLIGPVSKATLRVYPNTTSAVGVDVRAARPTHWKEQALTHVNRPPVPAKVTARSGAYAKRRWLSLDVTPVGP